MTARSSRMAILVATLLGAGSCAEQETVSLPSTDAERTSYALGIHLGQRLQRMDAGLDPAAIVAGLRAGIEGVAPATATDAPWNAGDVSVELASLARSTRDSVQKWRSAEASENAAAGRVFLAENRRRDGVVELPSGIQYRIVEPGEDSPPAIEDRLTIEYEGRLLDGAVFDTSADRNVPTIVRLSRTLSAWQEVLPSVGVGGTVDIWIPGADSAEAQPFGLPEPGELVHFTIKIVSADRHPRGGGGPSATL